MPELPEVETTMRGLEGLMKGQTIRIVETSGKKLRFALPRAFVARLTGARITALSRRAKYILLTLDTNETLLVHLGMSGRLAQAAKDAVREIHDHVVFTLSNGTKLVFNDPRRFGMMDIVATDKLGKHKLLRSVGIEPLDNDLNETTLVSLLKGRKTSIKAALLDQRIIAGLGNIYVSEALFGAGIRPTRRAGTLTRAEVKKLVSAIKKVLRAAIRAGGTSMRNYVQANGKLGFFQNRFAVYSREGKQCPGCTCGEGNIRQIVQNGRSTFYCPYKQR